MTDRLTLVAQLAVGSLASVLAVVLLLPADPPPPAAPLAAGAYVVGVADSSVALWVDDGGRAVVSSRDDALRVELAYDAEGRVLDTFTVALDGTRYDVEVDAGDEELYLTSVAPQDAPQDEVVVVQARDELPDVTTTTPTRGPLEADAEQVWVEPENLMADRVNGVAETIRRGTDTVGGAADRIGGLVRRGAAAPDAPAGVDEDA